MSLTVARAEKLFQRIFPPLDGKLFQPPESQEILSGDHQAARQVLALGKGRPWVVGELSLTLKLIDPVGWLLWQLRRAIVAEQSGQLARANYWWRQVRNHWAALSADHPAWTHLAARLTKLPGARLLADPSILRTRLAREILLDSHLALANGYAAAPTSPETWTRSQQHLDWAQALLADARLSHLQERTLLVQMDLLKIHHGAEAGGWQQATESAKVMASRFPGERCYTDVLLKLYEQAADEGKDPRPFWLAFDRARRKGHQQWLPAPSASAEPAPEPPTASERQQIEDALHRQAWNTAVLLAQDLVAHHPGEPTALELLQEVYTRAIAGFRACGEGALALRLAEERARAFPMQLQYQEILAELPLQTAEAKVKEVASWQQVGNVWMEANPLEKIIWTLEGLTTRFPACPALHHALAILHQRWARSLAAYRPAEALVAVARSLAYHPDNQEALELEQTLERSLESLTVRARELQARQTEQALSNEEKLLLEQAEKGTQPRDTFRTFGKAQQIHQAVEATRAKHLWLRIGLAEPEDDWDEQALALSRGLALLKTQQPQDEGDLINKWRQVRLQHPEWAIPRISPSLLSRFVLGPEGSGEPGLKDQPAPGPPPEEPPYLPLLPVRKRVRCSESESEPLAAWLFSTRDGVGKFVALAAVLAIAVVGVVGLRDYRARSLRTEAFARLQQAARDLNADQARQAIAQFHSVAPIGSDERLRVVRRLSGELPDWPHLRIRNQAYERLLQALDKGDARAALLAAEQFLEAAAVQQPDPRTPQVLHCYQQIFVVWFLEQDGPLDAEGQARVAKYRTLASPTQVEGSPARQPGFSPKKLDKS